MGRPRLVAMMLAAIFLAGLAGGTVLLLASRLFPPPVTVREQLHYGERHGRPLTLERIQPEEGNGLGLLLLVSGGWESGPSGRLRFAIAPYLRTGFTVFAVSHVSQPEATVMEIAEDIHRAVRFVRHHASSYGIDPDRLAITGASSGGHLSLLMATRGGPGDPDAFDPVERESSAVQAVAVFCPVTDLLNLGDSTENPGNGGPPKSFVSAFGPDSTDLSVWSPRGHALSPIEHINRSLPPILILHGDRDKPVPLDQSLRFQTAAAAVGKPVDVRIRKGRRHVWPGMVLDMRLMAGWLEAVLQDSSPSAPPLFSTGT